MNRIKIKGMVRAKGGIHSQQWYTDGKVQGLRKKCRTQSLWNLHLAGAMAAKVCYVLGRKGLRAYLSTSLMCLPCIAKKLLSPSSGDWHHAMETKAPSGSRPHLMRVMLIQNVAVDQRFANGAPLKQAN